MSEEQINAEIPLEEQLVAYLDGELDAQSSRRIEELLAADPQVRRKLLTLERTWELLDELETTPVDDQFTRTTMEMVAVAAEEDVRKNLKAAPRRRRRQWLLGGVVLLAAGLAGFLVTALMVFHQNRQLLNNLPLLADLDEYLQVKDIQFLRLLQTEQLLEKQEINGTTAPPQLLTNKNRSAYIKSLSPAQKADLLHKQERFAGLDPAKQEQLRQLSAELRRDPRADDLFGVMHSYYEWWKSLPAYSRDELSALPAAERINWIKKRLQEEHARSITRPPVDKDAQELWRWMEDHADKIEKQFLGSLPRVVRERLLDMVDIARRRAVMWMIWQRSQGPANRIAQPTEGDLAELMAKFTPETRKRLEALSAVDRARTIRNWAQNLLRQKITRQGPGLAGLVDDDRLAEFFEKDLTNEQRDRLMGMPGEDMQRELLRLYITQTRQGDDHPHPSDDFGPNPFEGGPGPGLPPPDMPDRAPPNFPPNMQAPQPGGDKDK